MVVSCPEEWGWLWRWWRRGRGKRRARGTWTRGWPSTSDTIIRRWGSRQYSSMVHKTIIQLDSSVLYSCSSLKFVAWCSCFCLWDREVTGHWRHCVLFLSKTLYYLLSTGLALEISRHEWKIVNWDVTHKQTESKKSFHLRMVTAFKNLPKRCFSYIPTAYLFKWK